MANKTPDQLTALTSADATDLVMVYDISATLLKKMNFSVFVAAVQAALGSVYLTVANNLSDLASASSARANLGLGTAATLASTALFQVANNLSEVASAATARTNIGAAAADAPTITSGMTLSGSVKGNTQALGALAIDVSTAEVFTKAISANSTFTITGATASKAMGFLLKLTISASAVPTWPASVDWSYGDAPDLANGVHWLGFLTDDGGTTWYGSVFGTEFA